MADGWTREARTEKQRRPAVPLAARFRMARREFLSESYVLYDSERNDLTLYLSDLSRFVRTFHINRSPHVLDDKFVFAVMLDSLQCRTAPLRALVGEGQFMSTDTGRRLDEAAVFELVGSRRRASREATVRWRRRQNLFPPARGCPVWR